MRKGVEIINDDMALIAGGEVLVVTGDPLNIGPLRREPSTPREKDRWVNDKIAYWGEDNDFPQKVIEVAEKSTELPTLLDWSARALQGKEILAMQRFYVEDEERQERSMFKYKPINDEEINDFLTSITTKRYLREASLDLCWFFNVFPELIKNKKGDKIAYIGTQDASFCRWGKQNSLGIIDKCYVNANWPDARPDDKDTIRYDVIDPYNPEAVELFRKSPQAAAIYPVSYPSPGKIYYQLAKWHGFITTGWAEIARSIPDSKKSLMRRILSAKYIIRIPFNYWPAAYKDWNKMSHDEQQAIKHTKLKSINDKLTGSENAGKSILNEFGKDYAGNDIPGWEIKPIENTVEGGEYLEDSREASEHLMRALGVDPTLVGDGPGKKMGSGSGSDKRVAFNIYVALLQPYRDVILEPLYFIAEYNGWKKKYPGLTFKVVEVELETLDKGSTSKEVTK